MLCGTQNPKDSPGAPRGWPRSGDGEPHGQHSPRCRRPRLVAVPRLSGTFVRVVTVVGGAGTSSPPCFSRRLILAGTGTIRGLAGGGDKLGTGTRCPPAQSCPAPSPSSHSAFGDPGGALPPPPRSCQRFRDGAEAAPGLLVRLCQGGNAAPGASCCFLRTPLLIKIISAPLLVRVTAGWAQAVAPLGCHSGTGDPQPHPGNKGSLLWL